MRRRPCGDDTAVDSLRGHLLIAGPGLVDPNFWRTVVLVGEHSEEGALGVVLNRTSETPVDEAVPELAALVEGMGDVHVGGPVQPSAIVVLADFAEPADEDALVVESVGFLPAEVDPDSLGPLRRARVYVGYAGWGPGQLDDELDEGSWIVEPALADDVFTTEPDALWSAVLQRKGGPFRVLAAMPPDPSRTDGRTHGTRPKPVEVARLRVADLGKTVASLPRAAILHAAESARLQRLVQQPRQARGRGAIRRRRDARRVRRRAPKAERRGTPREHDAPRRGDPRRRRGDGQSRTSTNGFSNGSSPRS